VEIHDCHFLIIDCLKSSHNIIYDGLDFCHVSHVIDQTLWCLLKIVIYWLNLSWSATITDPIPSSSFIWRGSVWHGGLTWQSGWRANIWCGSLFGYGPILVQWEIIWFLGLLRLKIVFCPSKILRNLSVGHSSFVVWSEKHYSSYFFSVGHYKFVILSVRHRTMFTGQIF
jgi:hypothetical protein